MLMPALKARTRREPEHYYESCYDMDCPRFPCRVYKQGFADGYAAGTAAGQAEGYAEGYAQATADASG